MRLAVRAAFSTTPELDVEPPDQYPSRGKLDQAIEAERDQADAARLHTCGKGDDSLNDHPSNGEPLEPECFPDQLGATLGGRTQLLCPAPPS